MKYIIDVPSDLYTVDGTLRVPVKVGNGDLSWYNTYIKAEPYTEPDRKAVENEVWDFTTAINYMGYDDFVSCFGGKTEEMVYELPYSEVKAEYEEWKKQKDEIHVGDVVVYIGDPNKENAIVLRLYQPKQYKTLADILCDDGTVVKMVAVENLAWTGKHFDEVEELLKKMREE